MHFTSATHAKSRILEERSNVLIRKKENYPMTIGSVPLVRLSLSLFVTILMTTRAVTSGSVVIVVIPRTTFVMAQFTFVRPVMIETVRELGNRDAGQPVRPLLNRFHVLETRARTQRLQAKIATQTVHRIPVNKSTTVQFA